MTQMATTASRTDAEPASRTYARFAHDLAFDAIPAAVRERAKLLILDAVGIALASSVQPFAKAMLAGFKDLGGMGASSLIGLPDRLPLRDAVAMNAALVHGLDFDDTHVSSVVHATAVTLPAALSVGEHVGAPGRDILAAYVAGMEAAIRIGETARFGFHHHGYHATGVVGHFSAALIAGRLMGLDEDALVTAQGVVGSTAMASQEFTEDGAWTKRFHPGWAAVAGITAAHLARNGFVAPARPYEGRHGLYAMHLGEDAKALDMAALTDGLGSRWETPASAVKPYPTCHFTHALADSALAIRAEHGVRPDQIAGIRVLMPAPVLPVIAEPIANKRRPVSDYDAKFSAPFVVAACLERGRFGLAELEDAVLTDRAILALADKVECEADDSLEFPKYFPGGVVVTTTDGRELRHVERINRGAGDRALPADEIEAKFFANAELAVPHDRAERVRDLVLGLEASDGRGLAQGLAA